MTWEGQGEQGFLWRRRPHRCCRCHGTGRALDSWQEQNKSIWRRGSIDRSNWQQTRKEALWFEWSIKARLTGRVLSHLIILSELSRIWTRLLRGDLLCSVAARPDCGLENARKSRADAFAPPSDLCWLTFIEHSLIFEPTIKICKHMLVL